MLLGRPGMERSWAFDNARICYRQDLALVLVGDRRREVASEADPRFCRRRFDQEYSHRFLRRKLFVGRFQTLETRGERSLVDRVLLANMMICAARHMVSSVRRTWWSEPLGLDS